MTFRIIQWNARSLIANGHEFKKVVHEMTDLPDLICIQETWLKSQIDFVIPGYSIYPLEKIGKEQQVEGVQRLLRMGRLIGK